MQRNINDGQLLKMSVVNPRTNSSINVHKNVFVNPIQAINDKKVRIPSQDFELTINQSHRPMLSSTESVKIGQGEIIFPDSDVTGVCEPIYAEIKSKVLETSELNKIETSSPQNVEGKKNDIIYWQISCKEVAKFKPCTETFIDRK